MLETFAVAVACVAVNVYHEARGEPLDGQIAVAYVTVNRAKKRKKSVCEVVVEPKQFSWTIKGVYKKDGVYKLRRSFEPRDKKAWKKAVRVAEAVLRGKVKDPTHGATFYHEVSLDPWWNAKMHKIATIGEHVFYRH